jgi:hypothetical protein
MLDAACDAESVQRLEAQRLVDEQVERALNDIGVGFGHDVSPSSGSSSGYDCYLLTVNM